MKSPDLNAYQSLVSIGIALSAQKDINSLLEEILLSAKHLSSADGGTLYLVDEDKLHYKMMHTTSLGLASGGSLGNAPPFPPLDIDNVNSISAWCAREKKLVNIQDVYLDEKFDFSGARKFDQTFGYRTKSMLCFPLLNHKNEALGVLQLINSKDPCSAEVVPFGEEVVQICEALASQAAIALSNRQLIDQLENLFISLIHLINKAIDEKSPYTAGHCSRVPEIALMLAEAVSNADYGALGDVHFSQDDMYELKIASLLHDCGKVVTPVHVVDKATKLETIIDRIDLVDMRFEVLAKDLEIKRLKGEISDEYFQCCRAQFAADLEFVKAANTGSERMSDADIERVKSLGAVKWIDAKGNLQNLLTDDEVYNLTIVAGTLTKEEREIINYHIVATINMLEALPWPSHLKNVPEYAGGHHERMDGRGYPKGLTGEQMSLQARIMAIADIFEALTAADRPYKKGKTLSEAIGIMKQLCADKHIDPDLFDVFLRSGIYKDFAVAFLAPDQIDEIEIAEYLS